MDIEKSSALNNKGLELFANGYPEEAAKTIRESYKNYSDELGILVNLGLTYIQQGKINEAEKCYQIALTSSELRTKRAAHKNLGFLHLSQARWTEGRFPGGRRSTSFIRWTTPVFLCTWRRPQTGSHFAPAIPTYPRKEEICPYTRPPPR